MTTKHCDYWEHLAWGDIVGVMKFECEIKFCASRKYAAKFNILAWMVAAWFIFNIAKISSHTTERRTLTKRYHPGTMWFVCTSSHSTINSICEDLITIINIVIELTAEVIICSKLACIWVRAVYVCMHSFHMPCNQLWLTTNFSFAFSF